jgi:multiple sugar transport system substrate-binding protein
MSAMGADTLLKDYIPYVKELGVSADGKIRAVSDHSSPGGFFYQREVAKKYLGTDDPAKVSDMVSTWDKIIALGKDITAKSNGKVHLIQNAGDLFDIEAYNTQPWVKDGALNIDPKWQTTYELQKKIRAENVDAKLDFMSAGWGNALNDGSAIYDKTPNKELAYEFVKFIASPEWQLHNIEKTGNTPGNGAVYEQVKDTFKAPLTGDQNVMQYYYELVKGIPATKADQYSEEVLSKWRKVAGQGIKDNASYDTVVASFKKEVKNSFPDLKIN